LRRFAVADARDIPATALEEVTEAAFTGVLRALERRKLDVRLFPGPIIVGIVAWPELNKPGDLAKDIRAPKSP
jgi:hypothetical protein